jgi:hypothetical protein
MTKTKREDAASIVGDKWAAKFEEYERRTSRRKHKSEATDEQLILKSQARSRILDLVEKYSNAYTVYQVDRAIQRTNQGTYDVAYGLGNWPEKVRGMQFVIQSFIDDLQRVGAWEPRVKAAVHRGVHRLKRAAEVAHTTQMVRSSMQDVRVVKAMVDDLRMRKVLGLR